MAATERDRAKRRSQRPQKAPQSLNRAFEASLSEEGTEQLWNDRQPATALSVKEIRENTKPLSNAREVPLELIEEDPDQVRTVFHDRSIDRLANSIKNHDLQQPIRLQHLKGGRFRVISGARRFRAVKLAGHSTIASIIEVGQNEPSLLIEKQLVENTQREDLRPCDRAVAMARLKDHFVNSEKMDETAAWSRVESRLGISTRRRQQILRLLDLPDDLQAKVVNSYGRQDEGTSVTERHVRSILRLSDEGQQRELFQRIANERLSSDEVAKEVKKVLSSKPIPKVYKFRFEYQSREQLISHLEQELKKLKAQKSEGSKTARAKKSSSKGRTTKKRATGKKQIPSGKNQDKDNG